MFWRLFVSSLQLFPPSWYHMDGADTPSHVNGGDGMSPFEALPEELLLHIFTYSTSDALRALGLVSQACRLRLLANDALLWRPRVLDLMTCSSASLTSDVIATTIEREAETLKASLAKMAGEDGSGYLSWRRFYAGVERLAANWAAMAYARRHWYHNTDYALTLRYTVEELTSWVYAGDEEEDGEDPEGWDKCSVDVLDVDIGGGRLLTAGDDGSVRAWDVHGRYGTPRDKRENAVNVSGHQTAADPRAKGCSACTQMSGT